MRSVLAVLMMIVFVGAQSVPAISAVATAFSAEPATSATAYDVAERAMVALEVEGVYFQDCDCDSADMTRTSGPATKCSSDCHSLVPTSATVTVGGVPVPERADAFYFRAGIVPPDDHPPKRS